MESKEKGHSHWRVLQHIRHDKETNHASPNVNLIKLGYTSIASRDGDVFQGDVKIILS